MIRLVSSIGVELSVSLCSFGLVHALSFTATVKLLGWLSWFVFAVGCMAPCLM